MQTFPNIPPRPARRIAGQGRKVTLRSRCGGRSLSILAWLLLAGWAGAPHADAAAQECPSAAAETVEAGWNSARALEIAASAIRARRHTFADSSLQAFRARAEGHVLFLADLGELAGQQLIRADQVALQVAWQAPRRSLQWIVGRRYMNRFPSRIRYHIDHISLVLDNFSDRIEIGEGEEVRDVLHPAALGALDMYQYRLVDSLGIEILGDLTRVYRLELRPACSAAAGAVGTMDVDRDSRAIARLALTFTRASYVDPSVDYVSVELESGHFGRRYWLPVEQRVEIRRQVNWLDFPLGGIIRTRFRILEYDLNPQIRPRLRPGNRVASLPDTVVERFAGWETGLLAGPLEEQWRDSVSLEEVRRRALAIVGGRYLGGNARLRGYLPDISGAVRGRRAEGLLLGAGLRYMLDGRSDLTGWAGYPLARERLEWRLAYRRSIGRSEVRLEGFDDLHTDIGPFVAATGVVSSFGLVIRGEDFVDPYFRDGATLTVTHPLWGGRGSAGLSYEEHSSGSLVADPIGGVDPRPVRPIRDGEGLRLELGFDRSLGEALSAAWTIRARAELAAPGDFDYTRWIVTAKAQPPANGMMREWEATLGAGIVTGSLPPQRLLLLGGRGTVPGYPFREWGGNLAAFINAGMAVVSFDPWVRLRAIAAAGWAELTSAGREAAAALGVESSGGIRASAGAGVGLLYDLLRVEAARGLDDGTWEWMVSVNPTLRLPL